MYSQHDSNRALPQILTISKPETATFQSILIAGFCRAFCLKSSPPEASHPPDKSKFENNRYICKLIIFNSEFHRFFVHALIWVQYVRS